MLAIAMMLHSCETRVTDSPPDATQNTAVKPPDFVPGQKICLNFGPYEKGQNPSLALPAGQLAQRLEILRPYASWIRTYGLHGGLDTIPALARQMGMRVAAGAWLGRDLEANEDEITRLIEIGRAGQADLLVVGSETLLRHDLTPIQLTNYLQRVKQAVPGIPVTTADVTDALLDSPKILAACDLVFANIYPYWKGISIECAMDFFDKQYRALKTVAGAKEVRISESGWPSGGNSIGEAKANPENAATYLRHLLSWAEANRVQIFVFEAFDENWKAEEEGPQGAHWGLFDEAGQLKPEMRNVLATAPEPPNWKQCKAPKPALTITETPGYSSRSSGWLRGQAQGVDFEKHRVVVLIRVRGVWWIKPYANDRTVFISPDGTWVADIVTGGEDATATEFVAFLVPATYDPPAVLGSDAIPKVLKTKAVAQVSVRRDLQ